MGNISFDCVRDSLLEQRLPDAFDDALEVYNRAECIVYMSLVKCLEEFSDVVIEFDEDDPVCAFFSRWSEKLSDSFSFEHNENGNVQLLCRFDVHKIANTIEAIGGDLFGTCSQSDYYAKIDNSGMKLFSAASDIEESFQLVKRPFYKENVGE